MMSAIQFISIFIVGSVTVLAYRILEEELNFRFRVSIWVRLLWCLGITYYGSYLLYNMGG